VPSRCCHSRTVGRVCGLFNKHDSSSRTKGSSFYVRHFARRAPGPSSGGRGQFSAGVAYLICFPPGRPAGRGKPNRTRNRGPGLRQDRRLGAGWYQRTFSPTAPHAASGGLWRARTKPAAGGGYRKYPRPAGLPGHSTIGSSSPNGPHAPCPATSPAAGHRVPSRFPLGNFRDRPVQVLVKLLQLRRGQRGRRHSGGSDTGCSGHDTLPTFLWPARGRLFSSLPTRHRSQVNCGAWRSWPRSIRSSALICFSP